MRSWISHSFENALVRRLLCWGVVLLPPPARRVCAQARRAMWQVHVVQDPSVAFGVDALYPHQHEHQHHHHNQHTHTHTTTTTSTCTSSNNAEISSSNQRQQCKMVGPLTLMLLCQMTMTSVQLWREPKGTASEWIRSSRRSNSSSHNTKQREKRPQQKTERQREEER